MFGDATGLLAWSISEKTRRLFPTTFCELARTGMMPLVVTWPAFGQPGSASVLQVASPDATGDASGAAGVGLVAIFPAQAARSAAASRQTIARRTDARSEVTLPGPKSLFGTLSGPRRASHATIRRRPGRRADRPPRP